MTLLVNLSYAAPIVLALVLSIVAGRRWCDGPGKRLALVIGCWYFIVLYAAAWMGVDLYVVRAGIASRLGIILVLMLFIVELIRRDRCLPS